MTTLCFVTYNVLSGLSRQLASIIPESRIQALCRLPAEKQKQSLLAEALARLMISELVNVDPQSLEIIRAPGEKPLVNGFSLDFSISHTSGAVAVICSHFPVGVDIELVREPRLRAAAKYFTHNEIAYAQSEPSMRFWEIWTRKEALAKAIGTGLATHLRYADTISPPHSELMCTDYYRDYMISAYSHEKMCINYLTEELVLAYHEKEGLVCL